jgi:glycosyltransferase involved in cell wall biosynthesis
VDLKAARVLSSLPALVGYLRRERPDALLSTLDYANVVAIWARLIAGAPSRMAVNEQNTISVSSQNSTQWRQRVLPRLAKYFYPLAGYIIGNSQGVAEDLRQVTGLPATRIQLIYNPVVTPELGELKKADLQHPWFGSGQPPVILAVGRLKPQKDFSTLIHAFAKVRKNRLCRLLILGEGPERGALEALIRELGLEQDVELPGFLENPCAYMSRASLFVLSSRWEGLPTVLIEALYCGVPIVSTDCPSGPREILAGGQYGSLVPVQDVPALAEAIDLGLSGHIPHPSRESWQPYELGTIVDQYIRLLLG